MRKSGVLFPVSSLPSDYGIGCLSKEAYAFVDWLEEAGQSLWQILPLGPAGFGDSPYQSFSTFAGNPYFIAPEKLIEDGLITKQECAAAGLGAKTGDVDYGKQYSNRYPLLEKAFRRFEASGDFMGFTEKNAYWLEDYALFMALKKRFGGVCWNEWEPDIRLRKPEAIERYRRELSEDIGFHKFLQYEFDSQWRPLHKYANERGIRIIGDMPIYAAFDSSDVWASPELFQLQKDGTPSGIAGVPPDGFSADGQVWGNPLYDWEYHKASGYSWWAQRMDHCRKLFDIMRIDHFRGFDEYFKIPYGAQTAKDGVWEKGPGKELFDVLREKLGDIEVIAEDLGYLTDSVRELVRSCGFPGMKVLEFAFDSRDSTGASDYLPYNYDKNCVVYTGTHDNETVIGWYWSITEEEREKVCLYLNRDISDSEGLNWDMIALAMGSVAKWCVIPVQDILGLDNRARINRPSTVGENWRWRVSPDALSESLAGKLRSLTECFGRK